MAIVSAIFSVMLIFLIIGTIIVIIFDSGDSATKIAWLLIITILPIIGLLLYFMVGINLRQSRYFKNKHKKFIDIFGQRANAQVHKLLFGHEKDHRVKKDYRTLTQLLSCDGSTCVTDGNGLEIITSGHRKFELLMEDLENAKEYIHMEYFYFRHDKGAQQIKEMLMKKAREGVKVRFIHENIANIDILPGYYNEMKKAGVMVEKFTKPRWPLINLVTQLNYRDHRKIVVIDGKIGYTGGMNINDHYFRQWRDTHMRLTGDAVAVLQYTFLDSWLTGGGTIDKEMIEFYPMAKKTVTESVDVTAREHKALNSVASTGSATRETGSATGDNDLSTEQEIDFRATHQTLRNKLVQIVPDEPDLPLPILQLSYEWALQHAQKYIYLQTPYFVPTEPVMDALKTAALCGVDVRLMLPEVADNLLMRPANRAYYEEALQAGVRIFLRKGEFIHAKTFVCDDYLSSIGSANLDFRSFAINYEVNSYIYDEETALMNKGIFMYDLRQCHELTLEAWNARPWYSRIIESFMRLFAPLL